ncbi:MAG: hypothetical protein AAFO85_12180 [Cyanobacteria bacterium J06598_4]
MFSWQDLPPKIQHQVKQIERRQEAGGTKERGFKETASRLTTIWAKPCSACRQEAEGDRL